MILNKSITRPIAALFAASLISTGCITVDDSLITKTEHRSYSTSRSFLTHGSTKKQGSVAIQVESEQHCVETTTVTQAVKRSKLRTGHVISSLLLLAAGTTVIFNREPTPASERTNLNPELCEGIMRDHPICQPYFDAIEDEQKEREAIKDRQRIMVLIDAVSLFHVIRAVGKAARGESKPREVSRVPRTDCVDDCHVAGKTAYLRVTLDSRPWCLELGVLNGSGRISIQRSVWDSQADRLPPGARSEFLADEPDAFLNKGQVVIPECGDTNDCLFWLSRDR